MIDLTVTERIPSAGFYTQEMSDWQCFLFGGKNGFIWRPEKGHVPNWFWRWMQYICFGNRWIKDK